MDFTQLLLNLALTITTILIVIVGLHLVFVLRTLRNMIKTDSYRNQERDKSLDKIVIKKHSALHSIINKVRFLSPQHNARTKKFFIKDK